MEMSQGFGVYVMQEQGSLHYGCDSFLGAELESQDTGSGPVPSHWEIRTFGVSV